MERKDVIQGLRDFAAFLEDHPTIKEPMFLPTYYISVYTVEELVCAAKAFGAAIKGVDSSSFFVTHAFGSLQVQYFLSRDKVCTAKRVTKMGKVQKTLIPAVTEEIEEEVEVTEWDCPESLLKLVEVKGEV